MFEKLTLDEARLNRGVTVRHSGPKAFLFRAVGKISELANHRFTPAVYS
jgi:hypothetical protein